MAFYASLLRGVKIDDDAKYIETCCAPKIIILRFYMKEEKEEKSEGESNQFFSFNICICYPWNINYRKASLL